MINTTSERLKARHFFICQYFSFCEQLKFRSKLSFITSGPVQGFPSDHAQTNLSATETSQSVENIFEVRSDIILSIERITKVPGPEVIKLFSCSTQLSTKFQLLIKTKIPKSKDVSCFKSLRCGIYHADVKIPTLVGILTFMSRINFVLS